MIKVEIMEAFGPFCGSGKFYSIHASAIHAKSVKKAVELAKKAFNLACRRDTNPPGVPILYTFTITKNGKEIFIEARIGLTT